MNMSAHPRPSVSIIINCFNGAKYLSESIDSVLAQTFKDWELILWDNRSTDESAKIFKSHSDSRFHYHLAVEHVPLGEARNLAASLASGEWIAFLDCDDMWHPHKLQLQMDRIARGDQNLGLVYGNTGFVHGSNSRSVRYSTTQFYGFRSLPEGEIFRILCDMNFIPLVSGLIRKSMFIQVGGLSSYLKQCEDYEMFLKIARISKVAAVNEVCCYYRLHDSNLTLSQPELSYLESIHILKQFPNDPQVSKSISKWKVQFMLWVLRKRKVRYFLRVVPYALTYQVFGVVSKILIQKVRQKFFVLARDQ
ncbi:MAG: glycosyltransferase [Pseudobdellovibrionaceae bacterium]|nr:glycosyltransferase [Pseudobdellovibrionaceae bacterium]